MTKVACDQQLEWDSPHPVSCACKGTGYLNIVDFEGQYLALCEKHEGLRRVCPACKPETERLEALVEVANGCRLRVARADGKVMWWAQNPDGYWHHGPGPWQALTAALMEAEK